MEGPGTRPNIVFVLADDLGWRDLSCYGSAFHETPVLDRLATDGMRFTDAYAAAPVCSPTRASLLTGRYPARVGVTQFIGGHAVGRLRDVPAFGFLPIDETSLARALADGGYQTWHVGKWHLGGRKTWPERHGFDVNIGGCDWGHPVQGFFSPYGIPTLADGPPGEYLTDRLTDEAISLIENAGDRPFFLNLWHYAVHTPIQAPDDLVNKYRAKAARMGLHDTDPFQDGEPMPTWHQRHQRVRRRRFQSDPGYAAMVENLDHNIGRLLDALDRTGTAGNTIVVFTSDNGGLATAADPPTSNAPLAEGKGWTHEGGIREPMIVRWPGVVAPGTRTEEPVTSPDLYPTLLEAAGLPARREQHVDGTSLLPLLRGRPLDRGPIFWHYPHYSNQGSTPSAAVRHGRWKLISHFEDGRDELYDLATDPSESHDLGQDQPAVRAELRATLRHWLTTVDARAPAPNPTPPWTDRAAVTSHAAAPADHGPRAGSG